MLKEQTNLVEEQIAIRRERAQKEKFKIKNIGEESIYSEYKVMNLVTGGDYKVAIRGFSTGDNYCACPDFRKNTLGTCKHIEAVLMNLEKKISKKRLSGNFVPKISEVYLHYADELSVRITLTADASDELKKIAKRFFNTEEILLKEHIEHFPDFLNEIEQLEDSVVVYKDVMDFVEREIDLKSGEREEEIYKKHLAEGVFGEELLKTKLYPYQKEGIIFTACRRRCILGDDMGLGKTIQAIGATELLISKKGIEKVLIICPASLKYQWKKEIERFTDNQPTVIEGNFVKRENVYQSDIKGFLITTYDSARSDAESIVEWSPDLIILDEAQRIKNWETKTAKRVKLLKSPYTFVLTGTPMENKIDELYSIVEYVDDRRLGPAFKFLADHTIFDKDSTKRVIGYKDLHIIREKLSPILLRRSKSEVLQQLPERTDNTYYVPMTKQQALPYYEQQEIVARIVHKWRRYGYLTELDHRRMMCALANMRMLCDSTYLFDKKTNFSPKIDELKIIISELIENGHKIVLFSQWTRMLEKVAEVVLENKFGYVYLHGGVPSIKRGELIQKFWEDENVKVFLSSDAGGVGLNLQAGSVVINADIPWNPAVLEQRIGRVHRMGQSKNVQVVNMITQGSIEDRILDIIRNKKALFDGVFEGTCDFVDFQTSSKSIFRELVEELSTADMDETEETEMTDTDEMDEDEDVEKDGEELMETEDFEEIERETDDNFEDSYVPDSSEYGDQSSDKTKTAKADFEDITTDKVGTDAQLGVDGRDGDKTSPEPEISQTAPADIDALFSIGKDILTALSYALLKPSDSADNINVKGIAKVVTNEETGRRKLHIDLPPDNVLKTSLKKIGQFLINIGD